MSLVVSEETLFASLLLVEVSLERHQFVFLIPPVMSQEEVKGSCSGAS